MRARCLRRYVICHCTGGARPCDGGGGLTVVFCITLEGAVELRGDDRSGIESRTEVRASLPSGATSGGRSGRGPRASNPPVVARASTLAPVGRCHSPQLVANKMVTG